MLEKSRPKVPDQPSLEKWQQRFNDLGAEWEYRGGDVCALYTLSGKVSDYYFNSEVISRNPEVLGALCREIYLPEIQRRKLSVDLVASYPPYGVAFTKALAQELGVESCLLHSLSSPTLERDVKRGTNVLVVADDIFSGSSVVKTIHAAKAKECVVAPVVFAFGNFSGNNAIEGLDIGKFSNKDVNLDAASCHRTIAN
jgi:orotate phosphoribosyltransferase